MWVGGGRQTADTDWVKVSCYGGMVEIFYSGNARLRPQVHIHLHTIDSVTGVKGITLTVLSKHIWIVVAPGSLRKLMKPSKLRGTV